MLRRANRKVTLGGDKLRKKMRKDENAYLSKRHIMSVVEDLCSEIDAIHPPQVVDTLILALIPIHAATGKRRSHRDV